METRFQKWGISFPFFISPMVGISHVAFRELIRAYTPKGIAPILFTEMLSTRRLPSQYVESCERLFCAVGEKNFIPQLLGNEEQFIGPSVQKLMRLGPWGFDINMGCPMKKTLGHNWGVLLMGDKSYAAEVVRMTKRHSPVPVSVKLRAGTGNTADLEYLTDFTSALEDAGADWITVHCRPREQRHRGEARWDVVGELAKRRKIPVVGNGDVQTADDAIRMMTFGVDGSMIARAATARPWILWQIAYRLGLTSEVPPENPEEEGREYFRAVLRLSCLLGEYFGDSPNSLYRLRYFIATSHRWLPFGHHFWTKSQHVHSLVEARDMINDYAEKYPQPLSRRITL